MTVKNYGKSGNEIKNLSAVTIDVKAWPALGVEIQKLMQAVVTTDITAGNAA